MNMCSLYSNKIENQQINKDFRESWNSGGFPNMHITNKCRGNAKIVVQLGDLGQNISTMINSIENVYINNSCGGNAEIFVTNKSRKPKSSSLSKNVLEPKAELKGPGGKTRRNRSSKKDGNEKVLENCKDFKNAGVQKLDRRKVSPKDESSKIPANSKVYINNSCRGNAKIIVQLEGLFEATNPRPINGPREGSAGLAKMNNKRRRNGSSKKNKLKKRADVSENLKVSESNKPFTRSKEDVKISEVCCVCLMPQARGDLKVCSKFHCICKLCNSQRRSPKECLICKITMDKNVGLSDNGESEVEKNKPLKHYCPVCRNLIRSKARYCLNLHLVCNRCFLRLIESDDCPSVCPTCRCDYPNDNLCNLMEEVLKSSTVSDS